MTSIIVLIESDVSAWMRVIVCEIIGAQYFKQMVYFYFNTIFFFSSEYGIWEGSSVVECLT